MIKKKNLNRAMSAQASDFGCLSTSDMTMTQNVFGSYFWVIKFVFYGFFRYNLILTQGKGLKGR